MDKYYKTMLTKQTIESLNEMLRNQLQTAETEARPNMREALMDAKDAVEKEITSRVQSELKKHFTGADDFTMVEGSICFDNPQDMYKAINILIDAGLSRVIVDLIRDASVIRTTCSAPPVPSLSKAMERSDRKDFDDHMLNSHVDPEDADDIGW